MYLPMGANLLGRQNRGVSMLLERSTKMSLSTYIGKGPDMSKSEYTFKKMIFHDKLWSLLQLTSRNRLQRNRARNCLK